MHGPNCRLRHPRHLIPSPPLQQPPGLFLVGASPLLKKEVHLGSFTLPLDIHHPLLLHRPGLDLVPANEPGAALAAYDHPADPVEVQLR